MSIIMKGMKSSKLISQGFFGRIAVPILGRLRVAISARKLDTNISARSLDVKITGEEL